MTATYCKDCNRAITGKATFKTDGTAYCASCTPARTAFDRTIRAGIEAQRKARKATDRKRGRP